MGHTLTSICYGETHVPKVSIGMAIFKATANNLPSVALELARV